ncbi:MAG: hypothetical protein GVY16_03720 [Planctomycetes bacterium]|nr:hypothetical protein [Planctomycetota bacterium]
MKSLRYRLGGPPRTMDDCFDHSRRHRPRAVHVELDRSRFSGGPNIFIDLLGRFTWEFSDCTVRCEECCGSFKEYDLRSRPEDCLRLANERFRKRLEQLKALGVDVEAAACDFADVTNASN